MEGFDGCCRGGRSMGHGGGFPPTADPEVAGAVRHPAVEDGDVRSESGQHDNRITGGEPIVDHLPVPAPGKDIGIKDASQRQEGNALFAGLQGGLERFHEAGTDQDVRLQAALGDCRQMQAVDALADDFPGRSHGDTAVFRGYRDLHAGTDPGYGFIERRGRHPVEASGLMPVARPSPRVQRKSRDLAVGRGAPPSSPSTSLESMGERSTRCSATT